MDATFQVPVTRRRAWDVSLAGMGVDRIDQ